MTQEQEWTPETKVTTRDADGRPIGYATIDTIAFIYQLDPWDICNALEEEGRCDLSLKAHIRGDD